MKVYLNDDAFLCHYACLISQGALRIQIIRLLY